MAKKTYLPTHDTVVIIDATDKVLGRLATEVASVLRGKHKPTFAPHRIEGDRVVVTNAAKIGFTGRKLEQKTYYRHTGYIGHLRSIVLKDLFAKDPADVVKRAVYGMLPNNRLRPELMKRLEVFVADAPSKEQSNG